MPRLHVILLLSPLLFTSCSNLSGSSNESELSNGKVKVIQAQAHNEARVFVGAVDGPMMPGAEVLLVTSEGTELLGYTNGSGLLRVPLEKFTSTELPIVLVCAEYYFCGAIRIGHQGAAIHDEYFIELAPFAMR